MSAPKPNRRAPVPIAHSRWELAFWVVAAGLGGALVMLLFLPDTFELRATPPPVRTPRLARPAKPIKPAASSGSTTPEEGDEESPADHVEQAGEEPTRRELEAGMAAVEPRVLACRGVENFVGSLSVRVTIARSGGVQSVIVQPPNEGTATAKCVQHAVQSATFAHFRGQIHPTVELVYPFDFVAE